MNLSYVLPIKWDGEQSLDEITGYLEYLSPHVDLIVVDGSSPIQFERHHRLWAKYGRHIPPHAHFEFLNGKVNGVMTGISEALYNHVILADDDVRYVIDQMEELDVLLDSFELVSPQNYFNPCPWHAKWDSSRSLLNLAFSHDYPGTLAVQRDFLVALGGYDGNVIFENLELIRTVKAGGGRVLYSNDLLIKRLPPSTEHFFSQRVRQAYDDQAQPVRLTFFILVLPLCVLLAISSPWLIVLFVLTTIITAEIGRRKYGAQKVIGVICSFYAPAWLLERGICTWIALFSKVLNGGVKYNSAIIKTAANSETTIRTRANCSLQTR